MKVFLYKVLLFFFLIFCAVIMVMPNAYADRANCRGFAIVGGAGGNAYYYDVNVSINGAEPVYLTAVPSYTENTGYLFQYFTRDENIYSFQVTPCDSHGVSGMPSFFSEKFRTKFSTFNCSATTVPITDPGMNQLVKVGEEVFLDAGDSYDYFNNDNDSILYSWECYAWPRDGEIILSDHNAVNPVFTPLKEGTYYFRLYVADIEDDGSFNRGSVRYIVVNAVKDLSKYVIANPGSPKNVPLKGEITLDGSFSSYSEACYGRVVYEWEVLNKTVEIQNADQPVASFIPQETGTYAFQLTVTVEDDFSSKITFVSVYDESKVGSLYYQDINQDCIDPSISDLDNDGDIDGADLLALALSYNSQKGLDAYKKKHDFDRNLQVDKNDLIITSGCYGKTAVQN